MTTICVNDQNVEVQAHPSTPLIWILREHLGLIGTKYGCDHFECGACSVQINGKVVLSCSLPLSAIQQDDAIKTVEGFSKRSLNETKSPAVNL
jgi:isoquinoline 1-oxidoreductase subunit alpha